MANEVTGKTLKYIQNGVEQAIRSLNFGRNFNMLPSTSTATPAGGKESIPSRAKTTIKIETDLFDVLGAEQTTGSCTAGVKYLVTGGTVGGNALGSIFQAAGNETLSATNKVKPLGAKITGATLAVTIAGATFLATMVDYNVAHDEFSATTTGTASPNTESVAGRAKITSKFECLMYRTTADQIVNAVPSAKAIVITFAPGITVTGNAILHQMDITDDAESGACKVTYNAEWQGVPTEVGIGYLTMATQQTCKIIFESGTTTNKEITGNVLLLQKSVTADVEGDVKISYDAVLNGAITPAVYS